MVEAERRSYADRSEYLGDPDFVEVPTQILLDSLYINKKMESFDWNKASLSADIKPGDTHYFESDETTHFSILDDQGNAVAVTTTLNGGYGSKVFVEELGVFLNFFDCLFTTLQSETAAAQTKMSAGREA